MHKFVLFTISAAALLQMGCAMQRGHLSHASRPEGLKGRQIASINDRALRYLTRESHFCKVIIEAEGVIKSGSDKGKFDSESRDYGRHRVDYVCPNDALSLSTQKNESIPGHRRLFIFRVSEVVDQMASHDLTLANCTEDYRTSLQRNTSVLHSMTCFFHRQ